MFVLCVWKLLCTHGTSFYWKLTSKPNTWVDEKTGVLLMDVFIQCRYIINIFMFPLESKKLKIISLNPFLIYMTSVKHSYKDSVDTDILCDIWSANRQKYIEIRNIYCCFSNFQSLSILKDEKHLPNISNNQSFPINQGYKSFRDKGTRGWWKSFREFISFALFIGGSGYAIHILWKVN